MFRKHAKAFIVIGIVAISTSAYLFWSVHKSAQMTFCTHDINCLANPATGEKTIAPSSCGNGKGDVSYYKERGWLSCKDVYKLPQLFTLPSGYNWHIAEEKIINDMYVRNGSSGTPELNGEEWVVEISNLDIDTTHKIIENFTDYYKNNLSDKFWKYKVEYPSKNMVVLPAAADGPDGSTWGYVQGDFDRVYVINLFYTIFRQDASVPFNECPCRLMLRVFESDPISPDDLEIYVEDENRRKFEEQVGSTSL